MPARVRPMRRTPAGWAKRGIAAIVLALAGYASVAHTIGSMGGTDPATAHRLAWRDGRVTAWLARSLSGADATGADRRRADRLARTALRQDPTAIAALATLGINAEYRGDAGAARRLFRYAGQLTRRDPATWLWTAQDAVGRGDVAGALRSYDIVLRTSLVMSDTLFPLLADAIADPVVARAVSRRLSLNPGWAGDFIGHVAGRDGDARVPASFFGMLHRDGVPVSDGAAAIVIDRLIRQDEADAAWTYYAAIRPGADRRRSRDPRFTAGIDTPAPFDWTAVDGPGLSPSIQRGDGGGVFDFAAPPSVGGVMLRQMQMLPPGVYTLDAHGTGLDQAAAARPYWTLTCRDGRELGHVPFGGGVLTVPAGCMLQDLSLVAPPSDAVAGLSGQVDHVRLAPR